MSTSDNQGKVPLTRKQLRELRLTGATPVIAEEAPPAPPLPHAAEPQPVAPAPKPDEAVDLGAAPLTRRQAREQERIRTASVPVIEPPAVEDAAAVDAAPQDAPAEDASANDVAAQDAAQESAPEPAADQLVSEVPAFAPPAPVVAPEPVVAAEPASTEASDPASTEASDDVEAPEQADASVAPAADAEAEPHADAEPDADAEESADLAALGVDADAIEDIDDEDDEADGGRPTVSPAFGSKVLEKDEPPRVLTPSFDELVGDTTGTQTAPSALIFNPGPGQASLSGPIASTGEVLITGTYELPDGIGSRGHAHGTTDGKELDAALIDGELPAASSPTPIAASSAISTSKPAGEVIRPPAPEKGNKLMLILAITAGGLALVLATALVIAFTTNIL